jgi:hypothetical protein
MMALGLGHIDHHDLRVLAERAAEAEPEVHRHADHQGDVRPLQPVGACPREEQLVVGRHAATCKPVEEHGNPQRLGQLEQRLLATSPVEIGPGHDHRALGCL